MPEAYRFTFGRGGDASLIRADGRTLRIGMLESTWGVRVRSRWLRTARPPAVRAAAHNLDGAPLRRIAALVTEDFWRGAEEAAAVAGFGAGCRRGGRSGAWALVPDTREFGSPSPWEVDPEEAEKVARWLELAFVLDDLRRAGEEEFDRCILAGNRELQVELSRHTDLVGAEVRTSGGAVEKVERLLVREGRACLDCFRGFAFADEATVVRRADGQVPARLGADPIMEEVFRIIEERGGVSAGRLEDWLDACEEHDPTVLYEAHIAPAVDEIEDLVTASVPGGQQ
jgi:hypothetical protein